MKLIVSLLLAAMLSLPCVPAAHAEEPVTVIFDQGHGQRFLFNRKGELQLFEMSRLFHQAGYKMMIAPGRATPNMLSYADVFVISGPFVPYTVEEADALYDFVNRGGRIAIMLHIPSPLKEVLDRFGVSTSRGVIKEREGVIEGNPSDFVVSKLAGHPLLKGLDGFSAYGVWGVGAEGDNVSVIASTSDESWEDLNADDVPGPGERGGPFGVVVAGTIGKGRFVVFGDDAIFQNKFLTMSNLFLGVNLVKWLQQ